MQISKTESLVPSTVVDSIGIQADSVDSFYSSGDYGSLSSKPTDCSPMGFNSPTSSSGPNLGNSVDQFSGWLASEGIIDIQSLLRSGNADISGTSDSGFGTGMDVDDLVSTSDSEGESSETNVPVPIEVQQVMALPPKVLNSEQKKVRRRELNRLAAQRSRSKKRSATKALGQEVSTLFKRNSELKVTLDKLLKEKQVYLTAIKKHFHQCVPSQSHPPKYYRTTPRSQYCGTPVAKVANSNGSVM